MFLRSFIKKIKHHPLKYLFLIFFLMIVMYLIYDDLKHVLSSKDPNRENTLIVGMESNYPPYGFFTMESKTDDDFHFVLSTDENIYIIGYDVWVAKRLAKALGKQLEIKIIDWEGLIPSLKQGNIDCILAGMSATEERKQEIGFSDSYAPDVKHVVMVNKKNDYFKDKNFLDKEGRDYIEIQMHMLYQSGTFYNKIPYDKDKIDFPFDFFSDLPLKTKTDENKYYYCEESIALKHLQNYGNDIKSLEIKDDELNAKIKKLSGNISVGVKKENTELIDKINNIIKTKLNEKEQHMQNVKELTSNKKEDNSLLSVFKRYYPIYKKGIFTTLKFGIYGTSLGFCLALILVLINRLVVNKNMRRLNYLLYYLHLSFKKLIIGYIFIFKSTPMIVQAMICFYGLKEFSFFQDSWFSPMLAAYLIIILNSAAYITQIIDKNISFLDRGQIEAANSLGMTYFQINRYIIFPQVVKRSQTAIINELIINLKDCAIFSILGGIIDIFSASKNIYSKIVTPKPYYLASLLYLLIIGIIILGFEIIKVKKLKIKSI
ncbi:transporter substrate-binding domain-containing protein ['Fragaria x ananassa' phyllody phytoplasma]|uniref:Transporter substrate-binding domain-containing protein n=1 Tax='Fragaria x ananassa' phyllody phytoplasma TaxID=2358428 RepID=A0ABS5K3E4_9MOLU|nr:transporter substrate-binding domain-containing protein ['Fragaria x ananassa' phyllody phytoplasma]MBS2126234.1 transporter substrate-binding domain-containing protein ['Fragaria x ananassa' phyllody phytoplasma]